METKSGLMEGETHRITQFYSLLTSSIDVIRDQTHAHAQPYVNV